MNKKRGTSTSNFGVSRRESHDASDFYARFVPPDLADDDSVPQPAPVAEPFQVGDARSMSAVATGSVALVVTSPPYFAGKQYEEELQREGVPGSYLEYLDLLREVFRDCVRVLEPGGRIAVNVANLGRKPYRSLSADVIRILQDDLGLLLRGEVIWQKGEGANGSCAWGSFRSATNPVLRDITERVIIASKGRFDRAKSVKQRETEGLPFESTCRLTEDFMSLTLDVWEIPPESARRVGHPAPFPVELPEQLIRLYTFDNDLVLDPFMGSGSALVAAAKLGRRYIGYDLDETYAAIARERVREVEEALAVPAGSDNPRKGIERPVVPGGDDFQRRATQEGKVAQKLAEDVLKATGFKIVDQNRRIRGTGVTVNFIAQDDNGDRWIFDVSGAFTSHRGGLLRTDTVWKSLGRANALKPHIDGSPIVFLTTNLPRRPSEGDTALRAAGVDAFFDAIEMLSDEGYERLAAYAKKGFASGPREGFWTAADLVPPSS